MDNTRITIRISKKQKKQWKDAVEESARWKDMTHLIFDSVETVLDEDTDEATHTTPDSGDIDVDLGPLKDRVASIEGELSSMSDDVEMTRMNTSYLLDLQGENADLVTDIYELIPTFESDHEMHQTLEQMELSQFDEGDIARAKKYGCVNDIISNFSSYGETFVTDEVNRLINEFTGSIHQIERDGHRFIYEVE
jgi:hypothetical protein